MTVACGASAKGEAETANGPVDRCPAERARQDAEPRLSSEAGKRSDERRAPACARSRDSAALKAGLDGNIVRATQIEEIAAKK